MNEKLQETYVFLKKKVVTLVLYTYFAAALLGRHQDQELYFPLFTTLQVSINKQHHSATLINAVIFGTNHVFFLVCILRWMVEGC